MENKKQLTKDQLVKIKEHIAQQIETLKKYCNEESLKLQAIYQCIPLYEQQLKLAEQQIKDFKEEPKKS